MRKEPHVCRTWKIGPWAGQNISLAHAKVCAVCGYLSPPDVVRLMAIGWEIRQSRRAKRRFYLTPPAAIKRMDQVVNLKLEFIASGRPFLFSFKDYLIPEPEVKATPLNFTKMDVLALRLALRHKETA